jgi:VanZ family protein
MIVKTFWKPICWAVLISILSIMPTDDIDSHNWFIFPHQDKLLHLLFYGIFAFLLLRSLLAYFNKSRSAWFLSLVVFLIIFLYGMIIEIIQERFIPSRQGEIMDMFFNLTGCIIGILLGILIPYPRISSKIKE